MNVSGGRAMKQCHHLLGVTPILTSEAALNNVVLLVKISMGGVPLHLEEWMSIAEISRGYL